VIESALVTNGGTVCFQFRSQNGFGGMNTGHAVLSGVVFNPELNTSAVLKKAELKVSETDGAAFRRAWNKHCANQPCDEKARLIKIALERDPALR